MKGNSTGTNVIAEGKTKRVLSCSGGVLIENKDDITAFDDPGHTRQFASKARCATATTCKVFQLLKDAGIPVAYDEQVDETTFRAPKCKMIMLEAVARRYAVGSYLKRNPQYVMREGDPPLRFHRLETEYFLKTTGGKLEIPGNGIMVEGLDPKKGEEDPFIHNHDLASWKLFHPKMPIWQPEANLNREVYAPYVLGSRSIQDIDLLLRKAFLVIEGAWSILGYRLIDIKLEPGIDENGNLLIADVVDNDNWRLRDSAWKELSKESFRQGEALTEVERKYGVVAELVQQFRIPKQAIVVWLPSKEDGFKTTVNLPPGIFMIRETGSGHKATFGTLQKTDRLLRDFPEGGVVLFKLGRSNGAGPVTATHTAWPVISVPGDWQDKPHNIWGHLDMPSQNPHLTALYDDNAVLAALNILAQKNPAAYMVRQLAIENLDSQYTS
jgi:phosphoribosylaminoimidazole carboxylase/phosphoribosylaminoimidazole-succinocarboxamide synthase